MYAVNHWNRDIALNFRSDSGDACAAQDHRLNTLTRDPVVAGLGQQAERFGAVVLDLPRLVLVLVVDERIGIVPRDRPRPKSL